MHEKTMKDDWTKITNIIKARFKRITDNNIAVIEENINALSDCLQNIYGFTKKKADGEYVKFKAILHVATKPPTKKNINTKKQKKHSNSNFKSFNH